MKGVVLRINNIPIILKEIKKEVCSGGSTPEDLITFIIRFDKDEPYNLKKKYITGKSDFYKFECKKFKNIPEDAFRVELIMGEEFCGYTALEVAMHTCLTYTLKNSNDESLRKKIQ